MRELVIVVCGDEILALDASDGPMGRADALIEDMMLRGGEMLVGARVARVESTDIADVNVGDIQAAVRDAGSDVIEVASLRSLTDTA